MIDWTPISLLGMTYTCWFDASTGIPVGISRQQDNPGDCCTPYPGMPPYLQQLVTSALEVSCPAIA